SLSPSRSTSLSSVEIHRLSPTRSVVSLKQPATEGFQRTDIQKLQNSRDGGARDGNEMSSSLSCVTMSLWKDHPVMTSSRSSISGDKSNHTTRFKMSAPLPNSQQLCFQFGYFLFPHSIDHEAMANMKTEFMALWDRYSTDHKVMVLAATNRPSELDEAIMRRLPQAFEIGMPERKERAEILKVTLKGERVPRPLSQLDLEKVLATSKKTQAAAGEYCGLRWSREPVEVEAAISGISKLLVSQFINLQSGSQDKTIHCASIFVVSREIVALHIRVLELLEDGDIRSIKPFEILKLLNLNSDSFEVVHVHSKP
ncbi:unnamed protein product, partial [Brassica oleracea]